MQRCNLLETRSNVCLRSGIGSLENSPNASIDKILMYLEDIENLKLVVIDNIIALSPTTIKTACYTSLEAILWSLNFGTLEENVLSSMNFFLEEKSMDPYAIKFIKSVGMPLCCREDVSNVSVRHPNIVPIFGLLKSSKNMYLVHPKAHFTLENILHFSPTAHKTDWHLRFFTYQVLSALAYSHKKGIPHGGLSPSHILLTDTFWCWLSGFREHSIQKVQESLKMTNLSMALDHKINTCTENCSCLAHFMELKLSLFMDWESDFKRWWEGELSNFEYLLALNQKSLNKRGDEKFPSIDTFAYTTQAGELFSGAVCGRKPPPSGTTIVDQMDLLMEQVKMLAGEVSFGTSSLKRLSEQATNNLEDNKLQVQIQTDLNSL